MSAKITTLCEELFADVTLIRSLHGMFAEMISQVAALPKNRFASFELATKVELGSLGLSVPDLDRLVPLCWNPIKMFVLAVFSLHEINCLIFLIVAILFIF